MQQSVYSILGKTFQISEGNTSPYIKSEVIHILSTSDSPKSTDDFMEQFGFSEIKFLNYNVFEPLLRKGIIQLVTPEGISTDPALLKEGRTIAVELTQKGRVFAEHFVKPLYQMLEGKEDAITINGENTRVNDFVRQTYDNLQMYSQTVIRLYYTESQEVLVFPIEDSPATGILEADKISGGSVIKHEDYVSEAELDFDRVLSGALDGEPVASDILFDYTSRMIFNFLKKDSQFTKEENEDQTQEILLKIFKSLSEGQFRSKSFQAYKTWAYTIANNYIVDQWRRKQKISFSSLDKALETDPSIQASSELVLAFDIYETIRPYLVKILSKGELLVMDLRVREDLENQEIAARLNIRIANLVRRLVKQSR